MKNFSVKYMMSVNIYHKATLLETICEAQVVGSNESLEDVGKVSDAVVPVQLPSANEHRY